MSEGKEYRVLVSPGPFIALFPRSQRIYLQIHRPYPHHGCMIG